MALKQRPWDVQARGMLADGKSSKDVALALGVSKNTIIGWAWRNNVALMAKSGYPYRNALSDPPIDTYVASGCRWIDGEPTGDYRYCGKPCTDIGSAWCAEHRKIVYRPIEKND